MREHVNNKVKQEDVCISGLFKLMKALTRKRSQDTLEPKKQLSIKLKTIGDKSPIKAVKPVFRILKEEPKSTILLEAKTTRSIQFDQFKSTSFPAYARLQNPKRKKMGDWGVWDCYQGQVNQKLLPHGMGVLYIQSGSRYVGSFANGVAKGLGTLYRNGGFKVKHWDMS